MSNGPWSSIAPVPIDWLLDGEPFVRYRALVDFLGRPENDPEVRKTREAIPVHPPIQAIFARLNPHGYWGKPTDIRTWWPRKDTTFWVLGILADFGLTRDDARIARACEYVLGTQLESGAFGWGPPPTPGDCFTGILCGSLAELGYVEDPRLVRAFDWMLGRQRADGGFWCKKSGQPGGPREGEPSCALGTLYVLRALVQRSEPRNGTVARRAAEFLLQCWVNRGKIRYAGHDSQIGRDFERLKYPFTDYRILSYLDALTLVDGIREDDRLRSIARVLLSKCDQEGRFRPESIHRCWSDFDFGQKRELSRWITLIAHRILRRIE
jgi:hypothetical protein